MSEANEHHASTVFISTTTKPQHSTPKGACKDWLMAEKLGDKESTIILKKHPKIVSDIYRSKGIAKRELGHLKGAFNQWEKASQLGDEESRQLIKKYSEELNDDENKKNLEDLWNDD